MSSFFTAPGAQKKRKRTAAASTPKKRIAAGSGISKSTSYAGQRTARTKDATTAPARAAKKGNKTALSASSRAPREEAKKRDDESVSGSDSDDSGSGRGEDEDDLDLSDAEADSEIDEAETAAERRLRLAERYLENVRREVGAGADEDGDIYAFDAEDVDRDLIAERLQEDVAESKGRVYRQLASELGFAQASHCLFRWNAKNVNAVAVCAPYAYTVSSDIYLTKWRIQDRPEEQRRQREASRQAWEEEKQRRQKKKKNLSKKQRLRAKAKEGKEAKDAAAAAAAGQQTEADDTVEVPTRRQPERVLYRRGNPNRRREKDYRGHVGAILCVAASQDGRFVVTGGADRRLLVWEAATLTLLRVFTHHRDAVTGLAFRRGTNQLYSCSRDRTIKVWSLDELAYVQTLFGHQDDVVDIDALAQEKCVSVGTRDRTARMWKVVEETQLVFRGGGGGSAKATEKEREAKKSIDPNSLAHEGSMDRVAMLDDELFVTGSDNGALALWSTQKKKPLAVVPRAHGIEPPLAGRELYDAAAAVPGAADKPPPPQPRWITALRTIPYSDVVLSGSWDGCVRVWRLSKDKRKLEAVGVLGGEASIDSSSSSSSSSSSQHPPPFAIHGVVNDIAVFERGERGADGLSVVAAVGQEHRLGRWGRTPGARNGAVVFEVGKLGSTPIVNGTNGTHSVNGLNGTNGVKELTNGVGHQVNGHRRSRAAEHSE